MWGFTLLVVTFLAKWILIGRYKAGVYPLWGWYYLRWWIVHRLVQASEAVLQVVVGTPIYGMYLRVMGASIGYNAQVYSPFVTEFDLVTIRKDSTIGEVRKNEKENKMAFFMHKNLFTFNVFLPIFHFFLALLFHSICRM
jgi:hypothetical protein